MNSVIIYVVACAWLAVCAWQDWKTRQISNWLTLPAIATGLLLRLAGFADEPLWLAAVLSATVLSGWASRMIGGGDAKITIALALISPPLAFFAWSGVSFWYLVLKGLLAASHRQEEIRLPGAPGFAAGAGLFLFLYLLKLWV